MKTMDVDCIVEVWKHWTLYGKSWFTYQVLHGMVFLMLLKWAIWHKPLSVSGGWSVKLWQVRSPMCKVKSTVAMLNSVPSKSKEVDTYFARIECCYAWGVHLANDSIILLRDLPLVLSTDWQRPGIIRTGLETSFSSKNSAELVNCIFNQAATIGLQYCF